MAAVIAEDFLMPPNHPAQRMFHGTINATGIADQLSARFRDRQHQTSVYHYGGSSIIQIGSQHGTPATVNIADTEGGVLVTMSRGHTSDALFCQACGTRLVKG